MLVEIYAGGLSNRFLRRFFEDGKQSLLSPAFFGFGGMTIFEHIGNRVLGNVCFLVRHAVLLFDDRRAATAGQGAHATVRSGCCSRGTGGSPVQAKAVRANSNALTVDRTGEPSVPGETISSLGFFPSPILWRTSRKHTPRDTCATAALRGRQEIPNGKNSCR